MDPVVFDEHQKLIKHFESAYGFKFLEWTFTEVPKVSENYLFNPTNEKERAVKNIISTLEHFLLSAYPVDMHISFDAKHDEYKEIFYGQCL